MLKSCFSRFQPLISRKGCGRKILRKISRYSSHWNLSIKSFDLRIRALRVPKSRTLQLQKCQNCVFYTFNLVSGAADGSKILKKSQMFLLVVSIDGVGLKIFHRNHHKSKNENEQKLPIGGLEKSHSRGDLMENPPTWGLLCVSSHQNVLVSLLRQILFL